MLAYLLQESLKKIVNYLQPAAPIMFKLNVKYFLVSLGTLQIVYYVETSSGYV